MQPVWAVREPEVRPETPASRRSSCQSKVLWTVTELSLPGADWLFVPTFSLPPCPFTSVTSALTYRMVTADKRHLPFGLQGAPPNSRCAEVKGQTPTGQLKIQRAVVGTEYVGSLVCLSLARKIGCMGQFFPFHLQTTSLDR